MSLFHVFSKRITLVSFLLLFSLLLSNFAFADPETDYVWLEGENANAVSGDYTIKTDLGASTQKILTVDSTDTTKTHQADFSFAISKSGKYAIWVLSSTGSDTYLSRYKWKMDDSSYQSAVPKMRTPEVYRTKDYRQIPMYWDKLNDLTLNTGQHSLSFITDVMREMTPKFYYHALDSIVIVPVEWNWTPDKFARPRINDFAWIEGEAGDATGGDYKIKTDSKASGLKTLTLDSTDTSKTHKAEFSFAVPQSGNYAVWVLSTNGSTDYVSRYKWKIDASSYESAIPLIRSSEMYKTSDSRQVPVYWDKLSEVTLSGGMHSFSILTDALREMAPKFYYHALDSIVIVPAEWNWTPEQFNKPFDPAKVKINYAGSSLSATSVNRDQTVTVTVKNRITEAVQSSPLLYAEIVWKGETVARIAKQPAIPMKDWQINQDYTDNFVLTVPFDAFDSNYEVRTGITGVNYQSTGTYAKVGDVVVGSPSPEPVPLTAQVLDMNLPTQIQREMAYGQAGVTLALDGTVDFETTGYFSFWKEDVLWGVEEIPSLPAGWNASQATTITVPLKVPDGLPEGAYQIKFGLHQMKTQQSVVKQVEIVGVGGSSSYKPLTFGQFADKKTGRSHTWYVNQAHAMIWDGKPFVPVGGMWTSKYLINFDVTKPDQNKANWEYDLAILQQMKAQGVKDIYINAVTSGTKRPARVWQWIVNYLEEQGFTYGLQFHGYATSLSEGYLIRANEAGGTFKVENVTASGEVTLDIPTSVLRGFQKPLSTLFLVVNSATGEAVQSGEGTVEAVVEGKFKLRAPIQLPNDSAHTVYFTPRVLFSGNSMQNIWDAGNATEQAIFNLASKLELGPNFRLFIDPIYNESGIINWYESIMMDSPVYRDQYKDWLSNKYQSLNELNAAWKMGSPMASFDAAARLIPLQTGPLGSAWEGLLYLVDPATGAINTADARTGVMWDDHLEFRDASFGGFNNRIADKISEAADAPVVYKYVGLLKRYNINRQLHGGLDGLGGEIYGDDSVELLRKTGDAYSAAEQSAKTTWLIITETQLDENVSRKAASQKVGYPDKATMHEHFNTLISGGMKGIYDFLFHTFSDANLRDYYSYTAKPEEFGWLEAYRNSLLAEARLNPLIDEKPEAFAYYAYPAGQMWWFKPNQRAAVLPGNDYRGAGSLLASDHRWALPTYDWNATSDPILVSLEDDPATTVWGDPIRSIQDLRNSGRKIVYLGLRKNLGALPNLDAYFTGETVTLANGDTVQVLNPTPTSKVLYSTEDGKVWGLRDGQLWIIANANWIGATDSDFTTVKFIGDLNLSDRKAPIISVEGIEDGKGYTDSVMPIVLVQDEQSGIESKTILLDGQPWQEGTAIIGKGSHTLAIDVSDRAGNVSAATVHFTIYAGTVLQVEPASGIYSDSVALKANLKDSQGHPVTGETILFSINGSVAGTAGVTDSQGVAQLNYKIDVGAAPEANSLEYEVKAIFTQNAVSLYQSSEGIGQLTVGKENASISFTGSTVVQTNMPVTLSSKVLQQQDGELGGLGGLPISFTILTASPTIANALYVSSVTNVVYQTDSEGQASASIFLPVGLYEVKSNLLNNSYYTTAESTASYIAVYNPHAGEASAIPGMPILSDDNGYDTGLQDGNYNIKMNMWYGENGSVYKVYENDVLIDTKILTDNSPNAQTVATAVYGKKNGTYRYYAELTNAFGTTTSSTHIVTVTKAAPAKPVLSSDNWDGDGNFKATMNMWWGTNGTTYHLYENSVLIDTQTFLDKTPIAQSAVTTIANRAIGTYEYRAELVNNAGAISSDKMIVKVTK